MVRRSLDRDGEPPLARDRLNDADLLAGALQHDALLDVKLHISLNVAAQRAVPAALQAAAVHRFPQRRAFAVATVFSAAAFFIQAGHVPRAPEGQREAAALLLGE
ncbi:hypothetical protein D3C71_1828400 [compost metagenome]